MPVERLNLLQKKFPKITGSPIPAIMGQYDSKETGAQLILRNNFKNSKYSPQGWNLLAKA